MKKALLIIDVQNFYFREDGLKDPLKASGNAARLLYQFREKRLPVFHIRHEIAVSEFPEGLVSPADIHESVKPEMGETVISKHTPGSFKGTDLLSRLRKEGAEELVICGMMSHMCVDTTTREAFDLDFKCMVIHDACATKDLSFDDVTVPAEMVHAASMASLAFSFAKVISTDAFLASL